MTWIHTSSCLQLLLMHFGLFVDPLGAGQFDTAPSFCSRGEGFYLNWSWDFKGLKSSPQVLLITGCAPPTTHSDKQTARFVAAFYGIYGMKFWLKSSWSLLKHYWESFFFFLKLSLGILCHFQSTSPPAGQVYYCRYYRRWNPFFVFYKNTR